jgi:Cu-Zn family superoxide dismutase
MRSFVATFAVLVSLASAAIAQEVQKHAVTDTATVVRVEPGGKTLVVRDPGGAERKFAIDGGTMVKRGTSTIPVESLAAGDRVAISAKPARASEPPAAELVQIVAEPATPAVAAPASAAAPARRTSLVGAAGRAHGEIAVRETVDGLLIEATLRDLPPGTHAFHVHAVGRCEPPFESAGDHLSPAARSHGFLTSGGPHAGDLVNLEVPADGSLKQTLRAPDLGLRDLQDADGAAFIVHQDADDYASQPSGNAGKRIACAAVEPEGAAAQR